MFLLNIILVVMAVILLFDNLKKTFKIAYYERRLENRNVDIEMVKNMPFYKLWLN